MQRSRNGRSAETTPTAGIENRRARQRALAVGVLPSQGNGDDPLAELKELLRTAGVATAGDLVHTATRPTPTAISGRARSRS